MTYISPDSHSNRNANHITRRKSARIRRKWVSCHLGSSNPARARLLRTRISPIRGEGKVPGGVFKPFGEKLEVVVVEDISKVRSACPEEISGLN